MLLTGYTAGITLYGTPTGELRDLKEDGDEATATVTYEKNGKTTEKTFAFKRLDGRWYIRDDSPLAVRKERATE